MAKYRFTGVDSAGKVKSGTVEAATVAEAAAQVERHGLSVRSLEAEQASPPEPSMPDRTGSGNAAIALAMLALVASGIALAVALLRDPLGKGLSAYDFTTPVKALRSDDEMKLNTDLRAVMQLQRKIEGKKIREKLDTLEVRRESEFAGKKLLFITFKDGGISRYRVAAYEKDAETGLWMSAYVSKYEVEQADKALSDQMTKWERDGSL